MKMILYHDEFDENDNSFNSQACSFGKLEEMI